MENENVAEAAPVPLSDIINKVEESSPAPEPQVEPEKVETPETPELKAEEAPEGETTAPEPEAKEETPPEPQSDDPWTKTAVLEERRKRQELERQVAELQKANQPQEPIPDQFDDPEGYAEYQENRFKSVEQSVDEKIFNDRLNASEFHVRQSVDEAELERNVRAFEEAARKNPVLVHEAKNHPSPWHYMNEAGKAELERQQLGDPVAFAAKVREEAVKEAEAKIAEQVDKRLKEALAQHLPKSLADEQTEGERTPVNTFEGPTPLNSILAGTK